MSTPPNDFRCVVINGVPYRLISAPPKPQPTMPVVSSPILPSAAISHQQMLYQQTGYSQMTPPFTPPTMNPQLVTQPFRVIQLPPPMIATASAHPNFTQPPVPPPSIQPQPPFHHSQEKTAAKVSDLSVAIPQNASPPPTTAATPGTPSRVRYKHPPQKKPSPEQHSNNTGAARATPPLRPKSISPPRIDTQPIGTVLNEEQRIRLKELREKQFMLIFPNPSNPTEPLRLSFNIHEIETCIKEKLESLAHFSDSVIRNLKYPGLKEQQSEKTDQEVTYTDLFKDDSKPKKKRDEIISPHLTRDKIIASYLIKESATHVMSNIGCRTVDFCYYIDVGNISFIKVAIAELLVKKLHITMQQALYFLESRKSLISPTTLIGNLPFGQTFNFGSLRLHFIPKPCEGQENWCMNFFPEVPFFIPMNDGDGQSLIENPQKNESSDAIRHRRLTNISIASLHLPDLIRRFSSGFEFFEKEVSAGFEAITKQLSLLDPASNQFSELMEKYFADLFSIFSEDSEMTPFLRKTPHGKEVYAAILFDKFVKLHREHQTKISEALNDVAGDDLQAMKVRIACKTITERSDYETFNNRLTILTKALENKNPQLAKMYKKWGRIYFKTHETQLKSKTELKGRFSSVSMEICYLNLLSCLLHIPDQHEIARNESLKAAAQKWQDQSFIPENLTHFSNLIQQYPNLAKDLMSIVKALYLFAWMKNPEEIQAYTTHYAENQHTPRMVLRYKSCYLMLDGDPVQTLQAFFIGWQNIRTYFQKTSNGNEPSLLQTLPMDLQLPLPKTERLPLTRDNIVHFAREMSAGLETPAVASVLEIQFKKTLSVAPFYKTLFEVLPNEQWALECCLKQTKRAADQCRQVEVSLLLEALINCMSNLSGGISAEKLSACFDLVNKWLEKSKKTPLFDDSLIRRCMRLICNATLNHASLETLKTFHKTFLAANRELFSPNEATGIFVELFNAYQRKGFSNQPIPYLLEVNELIDDIELRLDGTESAKKTITSMRESLWQPQIEQLEKIDKIENEVPKEFLNFLLQFKLPASDLIQKQKILALLVKIALHTETSSTAKDVAKAACELCPQLSDSEIQKLNLNSLIQLLDKVNEKQSLQPLKFKLLGILDQKSNKKGNETLKKILEQMIQAIIGNNVSTKILSQFKPLANQCLQLDVHSSLSSEIREFLKNVSDKDFQKDKYVARLKITILELAKMDISSAANIILAKTKSKAKNTDTIKFVKAEAAWALFCDCHDADNQLGLDQKKLFDLWNTAQSYVQRLKTPEDWISQLYSACFVLTRSGPKEIASVANAVSTCINRLLSREANQMSMLKIEEFYPLMVLLRLAPDHAMSRVYEHVDKICRALTTHGILTQYETESFIRLITPSYEPGSLTPRERLQDLIISLDYPPNTTTNIKQQIIETIILTLPEALQNCSEETYYFVLKAFEKVFHENASATFWTNDTINKAHLVLSFMPPSIRKTENNPQIADFLDFLKTAKFFDSIPFQERMKFLNILIIMGKNSLVSQIWREVKGSATLAELDQCSAFFCKSGSPELLEEAYEIFAAYKFNHPVLCRNLLEAYQSSPDTIKFQRIKDLLNRNILDAYQPKEQFICYLKICNIFVALCEKLESQEERINVSDTLLAVKKKINFLSNSVDGSIDFEWNLKNKLCVAFASIGSWEYMLKIGGIIENIKPDIAPSTYQSIMASLNTLFAKRHTSSDPVYSLEMQTKLVLLILKNYLVALGKNHGTHTFDLFLENTKLQDDVCALISELITIQGKDLLEKENKDFYNLVINLFNTQPFYSSIVKKVLGEIDVFYNKLSRRKKEELVPLDELTHIFPKCLVFDPYMGHHILLQILLMSTQANVYTINNITYIESLIDLALSHNIYSNPHYLNDEQYINSCAENKMCLLQNFILYLCHKPTKEMIPIGIKFLEKMKDLSPTNIKACLDSVLLLFDHVFIDAHVNQTTGNFDRLLSCIESFLVNFPKDKIDNVFYFLWRVLTRVMKYPDIMCSVKYGFEQWNKTHSYTTSHIDYVNSLLASHASQEFFSNNYGPNIIGEPSFIKLFSSMKLLSLEEFKKSNSPSSYVLTLKMFSKLLHIYKNLQMTHEVELRPFRAEMALLEAEIKFYHDTFDQSITNTISATAASSTEGTPKK